MVLRGGCGGISAGIGGGRGDLAVADETAVGQGTGCRRRRCRIQRPCTAGADYHLINDIIASAAVVVGINRDGDRRANRKIGRAGERRGAGKSRCLLVDGNRRRGLVVYGAGGVGRIGGAGVAVVVGGGDSEGAVVQSGKIQARHRPGIAADRAAPGDGGMHAIADRKADGGSVRKVDTRAVDGNAVVFRVIYDAIAADRFGNRHRRAGRHRVAGRHRPGKCTERGEGGIFVVTGANTVQVAVDRARLGLGEVDITHHRVFGITLDAGGTARPVGAVAIHAGGFRQHGGDVGDGNTPTDKDIGFSVAGQIAGTATQGRW